jgi:hypothetical protein
MQYETPPSSPKIDRKCPDAPKKKKNTTNDITNSDLYIIPHCIFPNISNINVNGSNFISTPINWSNYESE